MMADRGALGFFGRLCLAASFLGCVFGCTHRPDEGAPSPAPVKAVLVLKSDTPALSDLRPHANALSCCKYTLGREGLEQDVYVLHWSVVHGVPVSDYEQRRVGEVYELMLVDERSLPWPLGYPLTDDTDRTHNKLFLDAAFRPNLSIDGR